MLVTTYSTIFSSVSKAGVAKRKTQRINNDECVSFEVFDVLEFLIQSKTNVKFYTLFPAPHLSSTTTTTF